MGIGARQAATANSGGVLVIEDEPAVRFALCAELRRHAYDVCEASSCAEAMARFGAAALDVVVSDMRLPDGDVLTLLPRLRSVDPSIPIIVVTGYGTIDLAVAAVKQGASEFLTKPVDLPRLVEVVRAAVARRRAARSSKNRRFIPPFVSTSERMLDLESQVDKLRAADCSVLILGETGTGKSVLARRIHDIGARASGPFVDVNCGGFTREFVESELFGHERGAFTGAHSQKRGLLDAADGGTLFLDEIGDIDVQVQPKILKVIEEKRYRRMGDVREHEADVRLLAATHHDLLAAVATKTFRADLFYRISTVTLTMPALRAREGDIVPLARQMVATLAGEPLEITGDAEQKLREHSWPGNIRELKNVLERALLLRSGDAIRAQDLPFDNGPSAETPVPGLAAGDTPSSSRLLASDASTATRSEIEREHINLALAAENGRVEAAARRLGIPRSTLYQRLKTLGIDVTRSRRSPGREEM